MTLINVYGMWLSMKKDSNSDFNLVFPNASQMLLPLSRWGSGMMDVE